MAFCLIPNLVGKFKELVFEHDPAKLASMSSEERRKLFASISDEATAKEMNLAFEKKVVLVNKKIAMENWVKELTGIKEPVKRDLISRIGRMDESLLNPENEKAFLADLAEAKLGIQVTKEEAQQVQQMSQAVKTSRDKITDTMPDRSPERLDYGEKLVAMQDYLAQLKGTNKVTTAGEVLMNVGGSAKSINASLDNSFYGRQGIKVLYTNPDIWAKDWMASWGRIARQFVAKGKIYGSGDDAVMNALKADVYSRKNALNGNYKQMGLDIGITSEEAYPTKLPELVPGLGRGFKATEVAYDGAALKLRADVADRVIAGAEKFGVNFSEATDAKPIGSYVNALTGRGSLGKAEAISKELNVIFYSLKFLKSNIETLFTPLQYAEKSILERLGRPAFKSTGQKYALKQSAGNILKIAAFMSGLMFISNKLWPGSVETDPRSSNFGKIKIGDTTFDISGGMGGIIVLAARMMPTYHDGKLGLWMKSGTTGNWTQLNSGKAFAQSGEDIFTSYITGKLSPIMAVFRDLASGQTFNGQKPTVASEAKQALVPLSIQNAMDLAKDPNAANPFWATVADVMGISVYNNTQLQEQATTSFGNTKLGQDLVKEFNRLQQTGNKPVVSDFTESSSDWGRFKQQVTASQYSQAVNEYQSKLATADANLIRTNEYKSSTDAQRKAGLDDERYNATAEVLKKYGYKAPAKSNTKSPINSNLLKNLVK